jgi:hypothetical protein
LSILFLLFLTGSAFLPAEIILAFFSGLTVQSDLARGGFVIGMGQVFLIWSAICAVGTIASLVRGREFNQPKPGETNFADQKVESRSRTSYDASYR